MRVTATITSGCSSGSRCDGRFMKAGMVSTDTHSRALGARSEVVAPVIKIGAPSVPELFTSTCDDYVAMATGPGRQRAVRVRCRDQMRRARQRETRHG